MKKTTQKNKMSTKISQKLFFVNLKFLTKSFFQKKKKENKSFSPNIRNAQFNQRYPVHPNPDRKKSGYITKNLKISLFFNEFFVEEIFFTEEKVLFS